MLNIAGNLCELGDITADAVPGFRLQCADGRLVTVTGLTREETRALVPDLFCNVVLTFAGDNDGPTRQLSAAVNALSDGHDPLCIAVLRGRGCTCGKEPAQ